MAMSRKDYELLAESLAGTVDANPVYTSAITLVAERIATDLARTNPRFNRDRFLRASHVR